MRVHRLVFAVAISAIACGANAPDATATAPENPTSIPPIEIPSFAPLIQAVEPAVVAISVESEPQNADVPPPFRRFLFGEGPVRAEGSGFVISEDGYLLTNNHVVENATHIVARFSSGQEVEATVVGTDAPTDVALLKLEGDQQWPHVDLGSSSELKVGDWVLAVGNPFGLGGTVTAGIVSGTGRMLGQGAYDDFIQTDAAINMGNSGGPLFDTEGRVVGMNTAIVQGANTVGFAVPADLITDVLGQLRSAGHVTRGYIGVDVQPMNEQLAKALGVQDTGGALVASVQPGSPAADAGIRDGDVIVRVGQAPIHDDGQLVREVGRHKPGDRVEVELVRDGKHRTIELALASRPDQEQPQAQGQEAPKGANEGRLGVALSDVPPQAASDLGTSKGALVVSVDPEGPAAGTLRRGDVIVEVDGKPVESPDDAAKALKSGQQPVILRIYRDGRPLYVAVGTKPPPGAG